MYKYGLDFNDTCARIEAATMFDDLGSAHVTGGKNILQVTMAITKGRLHVLDGMYPRRYGANCTLASLKAHAFLEYIYVEANDVQYPKCKLGMVENCLTQWDVRKAAAAVHQRVIKDSVKCQPKPVC